MIDEYDSFQINMRTYENMFLRRFPLVAKTFGKRLFMMICHWIHNGI